MTGARTCTVTYDDGTSCDEKHKAHGLCARHDQQRRRAGRAGRDPIFTRRAASRGESVTAPSPPDGDSELRPPADDPPGAADDPSAPAPDASVSNLVAVEGVIQKIPADRRNDWLPTLARTLARSMDEKPASATARELRAVMKEVAALAAVQEVSALGRIRDEVAARRAARGAEASA